jgi:8-oxo-dGTP pyrophosphatase MutT (NUDIX family)
MHALNVASLIRTFDDPSDGAAIKSLELILMVLECSPDPFSRAQFTPGHITCTGLVLASDRKKMLMVHHRRLNRWLLPGGHVEPADAEIWDTARREVVEETGAQLVPSTSPVLVSLDVHGIPAGKGEPYHLHHDIVFHFRADSDRTRLSPESRAIAWCAPSEFDRYAVPDNVRRAYARARKLS